MNAMTIIINRVENKQLREYCNQLRKHPKKTLNPLQQTRRKETSTEIFVCARLFVTFVLLGGYVVSA